MKIAIIVAVARNGVIGRNGGLAWKISDDMKRFRALTTGKPVVMGRKTYDSIGKPLPNRANIVVSRSMAPADGVIVVRDVDAALARAREEALRMGADEICIIGGAEIYRKLLAHADRIHLTEVAADIDGDTHFPMLDPDAWNRRLAGGCEKSAQNEYNCEYFILDRR